MAASGEGGSVKPTMAGGAGPNSYSQNSSHQRALLDAVKEKINTAIAAKLNLEDLVSSTNLIKIADFGCSIGPNTFVAVQNIIDAVLDHARQREMIKDLEFQVFFNDHSSNDFNTLFQTLPDSLHYFPMGVPGSFFGQVLPTNSLHIAHSSYTLQWLSEVPKGIADRESNAWNGGSIHCSGFAKEVKAAYFEQFKIDMERFLSARAKEMIPGGLILLLGSSLPDGVIMSETLKGKLLDIAGNCLYDLADSGKIKKEEVDKFNIPVYFANIGEYRQVIEQNGCYTIEIMDRVRHSKEEFPLDVKFLSSSFRATLGETIADRFGAELVDEHFMKAYAQSISHHLHEFKDAKKDMQYFILLRRN